jgi:cytoskeletal protein CcmA (bactofilin family)
MKQKFATFLALILAIMPTYAFGETVVRTGESISIESNQVVENDFYAAAETISMSGSVRGDMYVVGGRVTTNGEVENDLTIIAGTAQVHAPVKDDLRVLGGEVVLAEKVSGDVFVVGGYFKMLSTASVDGNVYFYGGQAEISGTVAGSVMGTAESFRVDGEVKGGVDVVASSELVLGDRANVSGNVSYESLNELIRAQNAVVVGEVLKNERSETKSTPETGNLLPLFIALFTVLTAYLFLREQLQTLTNGVLSNPVPSVLTGLLLVFVAPVVSIVLMVTVIGSLVGIMFLFLLLCAYIFALVLSVVIIGKVVLNFLNKGGEVSLLTVFVGVGVMAALSYLSVVGPFVIFSAFVLSLGGLGVTSYKLWR